MALRSVTVLAPAKVNLFLGVGSVRSDGYHDVTTVLHSIELCDRVCIESSDRLSLVVTPDLGIPVERNLVWRAVTALADALGVEPAVAISLEKHVPHAAGLGGGSSDAAAALLGVSMLWDVESTDPRVLDVARFLGADIPFFLLGGPALMQGRGDLLVKHVPAISAPVVLIKPADGVETAAAYAEFDRSGTAAGDPSTLIAALESSDIAAVAAALENNLALTAGRLVAEVAQALAWCTRSRGVLGAQVAGSGSAVFALCADEAAARALQTGAREQGWWSTATTLRPCGVAVDEGMNA